MVSIFILTFLVGALLTFWIYRHWFGWKSQENSGNVKIKVPPGPLKWPFLGNLMQIVKNPHLKLSGWADKYGKLYTIHLGSTPALIVNDSKVMKELLSQNAALGKFKTDSMWPISQGPYGILNTEGKSWSEQRQFCVRTMIQFGFGTSTLESLMLEEIQQVFAWMTKQIEENGGEVRFDEVLKSAANNALWTVISGERVAIDDPKVTRLLDNFLKTMQYTLKTGLGFFPWLRHLAPELSGYNAYDKACKDLHEFMGHYFEEHKQTRKDGSTRDVIDAYLERMAEASSDPNSPFSEQVGLKNSVSTMVEIFTGSGDTTSATLIWLAFYLSWQPETQTKLWEEIDRVLGQNREPTLTDKSNMPYTDAVISEILRITSLVPLGIFHQLTENLQFQGYTLPQGMLIIPNIYHCHHSKNIWKDPENFRPERFLNEPELKERVVPFQPGKRSCPGEPFVRDMLFIFITSMYQQWEVAPSPSVPKEKYFEADVGVLILPKKHSVVAKKRQYLTT